MNEGLDGNKAVKGKFFNVLVQDGSISQDQKLKRQALLKESMDQKRRLEHTQSRNQKMQEDADKEISRLIEASRKAHKKINEDLVKEVEQMLEKSIKKQTELAVVDVVPDPRAEVDVIKSQRWVYATLNSNMEKLNPAVQYPSKEQYESLSPEKISEFTITGVIKKDGYYKFDFLFKNGLKTNSGCAPPMTEHLIKPVGAIIRSIDIQY